MSKTREMLKINMLFKYQRKNKVCGYIEVKNDKLIVHPTTIKYPSNKDNGSANHKRGSY